MKILLSWLNDFVKVNDIPVEDLATKLVDIGFEVEEILNIGEGIENVVTGKILSIEKHPNAEKLSVCEVDLGTDKTIIITGANNIKVGDVVPIAKDGATIKGGKKIVSSPLRGVMSYGMMCSGSELGVDENIVSGGSVDGILILDNDTPVGSDIKEVLGLNDYVLNVSITANRPDCQSIFGIAREISAILGRKLNPLKLSYNTITKKPSIKVEIKDKLRCSRYCGREIHNVKVQESPLWMRKRLSLVEHNAINNIVDITNYVLVEVGQPLHAFDIRQINEKIIVRTASEGEKIVALDKSEYSLNQNMLVIADSEKALAVAGVMGGQYSGISDDTTSVFLESARFSRGTVRTTSRQLSLRSDSSARYEKGVDWQSVDYGRERALALFSELKVGEILADGVEDGVKTPQMKTIKTSIEQINNLLGISIEEKEIVRILNALGIESKVSNKVLTSCIPLFREDIENYTDLAEEVIRFYGYNNIVPTVFNASKAIQAILPSRQKRINDIKQYMVGCGALEAITYSFINPNQFDRLLLEVDDVQRNAIRILNPLSEEFSVMRTQGIGNMLDIVHVNASKRNENYRLFEIARVYKPLALPLKELPKEEEVLTLAFSKTGEDFYSVKNVVVDFLSNYKVDYALDYSKKSWLHPGISADLVADGVVFGSFGKIHPLVAKNFSVPESVFLAEINLENLLEKSGQNVKYVQLPKFPNVERDLAFMVKIEHSIGSLIKVIKDSASELCEEVVLFDIYEGEQIESGYKSVAFSIKLRASDRTLAEEEIQSTINRIINEVSLKFDAKLRM